MNKRFKYYLLTVIGLIFLVRYLMHYRCQALREKVLKKIEPKVLKTIKGARYLRKGSTKATSSKDWEAAEVYLLQEQLFVVRYHLFFDRIKTYKSILHLSAGKAKKVLGAGKPIVWKSISRSGDQLKIQCTLSNGIRPEKALLVLDFSEADLRLEQLLHLLQKEGESSPVFVAAPAV